ncbi:MAG: hypothetical protein HY359_17395 [Candidatus Rokubacteria bacterium]|nr:hypothetical protein [Candidatus Rokubacteria bacterium]
MARAPVIVPFGAEAADRLPALLYEHFGYSYSADWMYSPARIRQAMAGGTLDAVVAVDGDALVGYLDLRFSFGSRQVVEIGIVLVDPALDEVPRARVAALLLKESVERIQGHVRDGLRLVTSTETTDHTGTQRWLYRAGMVPTGLLFATVPAGQHLLRPDRYDPVQRHRGVPERRRQRRRRSEVLSVYPVRELIAPYGVELPERFAEILDAIYARLAMPVTFRAAGPASGPTELTVHHNVGRGTAILDVARLGADAPARLVERLEHYVLGHVPSVQLFVPLDQGRLEPTLAALIAAGCRFGGLVPHFKGSDRLVLQRASDDDPLLTEAHLADEVPRRILRLARQSPVGVDQRL